MPSIRSSEEEAATWFAKLSRRHVTLEDVKAFGMWRAAAANDAAYRMIEREGLRTRGRFVVLPDPQGFSVIDTWLREPATFANAQHTGVARADAEDICDLLNRRTVRGGARN